MAVKFSDFTNQAAPISTDFIVGYDPAVPQNIRIPYSGILQDLDNVVNGALTFTGVWQYANFAAFPAFGEVHILYVDLSTSYTYYWNDTIVAYVQTKVVPTIVSYATSSLFPATGQSGYLYIDLSTAYMYYWGGAAYVQVISPAAPAITASIGLFNYYNFV